MNLRHKLLPMSGSALIIVSLFLLLAAAGSALSDPAENPRDPETVDLSSYNRAAGPVTFVHKDHGNTGSGKPSCSDCHHTTARDQVPEKCGVCHLPLDDSAAPTDAVAFHKLCIGCHKSEIERGDKRLSLGCDSCHAAGGDQ